MLVEQNEEVLLRADYGMADLELGVELRPDLRSISAKRTVNESRRVFEVRTPPAPSFHL